MPQQTYRVQFADGSEHSFQAPVGMSDTDLANRANQEWDFANGQHQGPQEPQGSAISRFFGNAWDAGKSAVKGAVNLAGDVSQSVAGDTEAQKRLGQTGRNLVSSQIDQFKKAKTDYDQGHYSEMLGHAGAGVLPVLGPAAAEAGEQMGTGDIAGGAGRAAVVLASALAPDLKMGVGKLRNPVAEGLTRAGQLAKSVENIPAGVQHATASAVGAGTGLPGFFASEAISHGGPPLVRAMGTGLEKLGNAIHSPSVPAQGAGAPFSPMNTSKLPSSKPKFVPPDSSFTPPVDPSLTGLKNAAAGPSMFDLPPVSAAELPRVEATSSANAQVPKGAKPADMAGLFADSDVGGGNSRPFVPSEDFQAQMDFLHHGRQMEDAASWGEKNLGNAAFARKQAPALAGLTDAASWGFR